MLCRHRGRFRLVSRPALTTHIPARAWKVPIRFDNPHAAHENRAMATIAVIGAGAVGGYYGARLARAGHDVRFLLRRDLNAVRERGLRVHSHLGDFHLPVVTAAATPAELGVADWVICSLKATSLADARELVAPSVGPATRVVALMNGLGVEAHFSEWFGAQRVFGGMAFVCINRGEPGVIHHLDYGRVSIGHVLDNADENAALEALLTSANIETVVAPNLRYARWEKLCWNVPFNGLSVAGGGIGTATILADAELRATAECAMREVVAAANADLADAGSDARLDPDEVVQRMFALTATMGDYRTSMVIDYVNGAELEVEAILGNPVRRARELGLEVPTMAALYALVRHAGRVRLGLQPVLGPVDLQRAPTVV
jgi:2-dehydropantoate 2-reductase